MRKQILAGCFLAAATLPAAAADMAARPAPVVAPPVPVYSWTGFYLGGQLGYAWTKAADISAFDNAALLATYGRIPEPAGFIGGLHAGYHYQFPSNIVVGLEVEANGFGISSIKDTSGLVGSTLTSEVDWDVGLYGKLGYAMGTWMPYILGGGAWTHNSVNGANGFIGPFAVSNWHSGWTLGGGIAGVIAGNWVGRVQYRYIDVGSENYLGRQIGGTGSIIEGGLSYKLN